MDEERIQLTSEESGERIDALLSRIYPGLSRSLIQKCIEAGAVTLDGRAIKKNARAQAGGELLFRFPETAALPLEAQDIPLDVVYEDGDLIVVNKPRGMVVHPAPGHPDGTLVNALLFSNIALCGASGVCFSFILLSSFTSFTEGEIPLTFILVAVLFLGQQIINGIFVQDNISYLSHIIGGIVGAGVGFGLRPKRQTSIFS